MSIPEITIDTVIGGFVVCLMCLGVFVVCYLVIWYLTKDPAVVPGRDIGTVPANLDLPEGH